jgi:DNA-3-methyladenine glycosylase II
MPVVHARLSAKSFYQGLGFLCERDEDLAAVLRRLGPPPLWIRKPGFPTLIQIILEQQVSLASARAAFDRLQLFLPCFSTREFLRLDDATLKQIGFSRQKTNYTRNIARAVETGGLLLDDLPMMDDEDVRLELQKIKGIGRWTADIYLLMALKRTDIWPVGDLALLTALQQIKNLSQRPSALIFEAIGEPWRPWRAIAARILWHHYLAGAN